MKSGARILALLLLVGLAACSREPAPAAPEATPPAAATPAAATSASPATPAPVTPAGESNAVDAEPADKGSAALERVVPLPEAAQLPAGRWQAGTHYRVVSPAQPTDVSTGKVEVLEVFWYACPHCFALEPYLESWQKKKPAYVEFVRVPVIWGPIHRAHAQLYYTLKALGKLDALNERAFQDVHHLVEQQQLPLVAPNDDAETLRMMTNWAKTNGISAKDFTDAWNSFSVNKDLQSAEEITRRYKIEGVPLVVINGKYITDIGMASAPGTAANPAALISLIDDLAASEKRH
jgi:thiol:disulfide interchange protein DsbA